MGHDAEKPVRFLGMDLSWDPARNLVLSQASYIRELGNRYEHELNGFGHPVTPLCTNFNEDLIEDQPAVEDIRKAQALVGELLWTSIRTRPDCSYTVSKLASQLSKAPKATWRWGMHTLAYLLKTADVRLTYWAEDRAIWSEYKRRPNPTCLIEGFGDASFAPEAKRSVQCLQVFAEGNLVSWSVTRQAFMAQSSCEAEMIALMDLANYTLSAAFSADELCQRRVNRQLLGDNLAASAIYGGTGLHWRTRHLRIRAKAFLEKCADGALPAYHIAGEWNSAGLGTKPLASLRHWKLCDLIGLLAPASPQDSF